VPFSSESLQKIVIAIEDKNLQLATGVAAAKTPASLVRNPEQELRRAAVRRVFLLIALDVAVAFFSVGSSNPRAIDSILQTFRWTGQFRSLNPDRRKISYGIRV
jgi:hypothetical protein